MPTMSEKGKAWGQMTARSIMQTNVLTVSTSTPLSDVDRMLGEHRIGGLPVTDEAGHIAGVISMRDLLERYCQDEDAQPRRSHGFYHLSSREMLEDDFDSFEVPAESEETAGEVMTAEVYSVDADAGLDQIAQAMSEKRIHRVLVQEDEKYVGLISTMDILSALAR